MAQLMHELLAPTRTEIFQLLGEGDSACWLRSAALGTGIVKSEEALPEVLAAWLRDSERHWNFLKGGHVVTLPDGCCQTLVPLHVEQTLVGVLALSQDGPLSDAQALELRSMLRFYGNLRALLEENERDALTGLLNRKSFDETFSRVAFVRDHDAVDRVASERRGEAVLVPCWMVVLDIDHFKRVNDSFGHLVGDEVLLRVAGLLRTCLRGQDLIYRFGGEEFVLLLRGASADAVLPVLERVRQSIAGHIFPHVGHITVSLGFTRVGDHDSPAHAFDRADQAVYWVKQNGRNQCKEFNAEVALANQEARDSGMAPL
jgi:diguanylate cyclase (GGDEF)-like protein